MFCVKDYSKYGIDYYFCRTIEKAKEIFDRVFWEWVKTKLVAIGPTLRRTTTAKHGKNSSKSVGKMV